MVVFDLLYSKLGMENPLLGTKLGPASHHPQSKKEPFLGFSFSFGGIIPIRENILLNRF